MSEGPISASARKRSIWVAVIIFSIFAVLLLRILYIQTVDFEKYQAKVINQMTTQSRVAADRGKAPRSRQNAASSTIETAI